MTRAELAKKPGPVCTATRPNGHACGARAKFEIDGAPRCVRHLAPRRRPDVLALLADLEREVADLEREVADHEQHVERINALIVFLRERYQVDGERECSHARAGS